MAGDYFGRLGEYKHLGGPGPVLGIQGHSYDLQGAQQGSVSISTAPTKPASIMERLSVTVDTLTEASRLVERIEYILGWPVPDQKPVTDTSGLNAMVVALGDFAASLRNRLDAVSRELGG